MFSRKDKLENNFKILQKLGEGASGAVYKVRYYGNEKDYALKFIPMSMTEDITSVEIDGEEFLEVEPSIINPRGEYDLLRQLSEDPIPGCYPGIVCYYGVNEYFYNGVRGYGILMEYVKGIDLSTWALEKPSEKDIKFVIMKVLQSLHYMHKKKISHRDIKLENIILRNGLPVIVDLGISCTSSKLPGLPYCRTIAGTPAYLAPEVWSGAVLKYPQLWTKSDIWATGVMLYVLLSRQFPWNGTSEQIRDAILSGINPPDILVIDPQLRQILNMMLERNPLERSSAYDILVEIGAPINY